MKRSSRNRITLMLVGFIAASVLGGIEHAKGATITVGPGGAYDVGTIQAGIDGANNGDTILVAPGEYVITEPITFRGKAITVRSETGPEETTIRMGTPADINRACVVIFESSETDASILEGFTITGGRGLFDPSVNATGGGGIVFYASSGTLKNCIIEQNSADAGGGLISAGNALVTINDCTITGNSGTIIGGGVYAVSGGSLSLANCTIRDNSATNSGGGVGCYENASVSLGDCIIRANSAGSGGGLFCSKSSVLTLTNCVISKNSAEMYGGAVGSHARVNMTKCLLARNTAGQAGGGVSFASGAVLTASNCTIWGNSGGALGGGGVACWGSATIIDSIIWANTSPKGRQIVVQGLVTIGHSDVAGGQADVSVYAGGTLDWGEGNIDVDPYFADPTSDNYYLKSQAGRWDPNNQTWIQDDVTSLCIDAGDPMSPIGWESFPNGGFVNMGAYGGTPESSKSYFGEPVCETIIAGDINGDGQVNRADLEIMALHWTDEEPLLP